MMATTGAHTAVHLTLDCPDTALARSTLRKEMPIPIRTYKDFETALHKPAAAKVLVHWFHKQQFLPEYRLALEEEGWADDPGIAG